MAYAPTRPCTCQSTRKDKHGKQISPFALLPTLGHGQAGEQPSRPFVNNPQIRLDASERQPAAFFVLCFPRDKRPTNHQLHTQLHRIPERYYGLLGIRGIFGVQTFVKFHDLLRRTMLSSLRHPHCAVPHRARRHSYVSTNLQTQEADFRLDDNFSGSKW